MKIAPLFLHFLSAALLLTASVFGREVSHFNDNWQFKKGPFPEKLKTDAKELSDGWEDVKIPHTWNAHDMQYQKNKFYAGNAYYKKTFQPDASWKDKRVFLRFQGVGSVAEVYVNKDFAGNHKGAYSAFAIEITDLLKQGQDNTILVKADNSARPDVIPVNHTLFGVYGGIYRPVELIVTDKLNISVLDYASPGIYLRQQNVSADSADLTVKAKLENKWEESKKVVLRTTIYETDGKTVKAKQERPITVTPQGRQSFEQDFKIEKPHLWQAMEDPYLYQVVTQILEGDKIIDEQTQPLGLRHFDLKTADGMYLNGKKVPMYGVCRHQDWQDKGSALTDEQHDADLSIMKEIGATTIRFAHYQQAERIYSQCDKMGFIIWVEIPFVNRTTTEEKENAKQQLTELIRQNYNHPSIYTWGLHNEVYSPANYVRSTTMELNDLAKTEDPDRYTVAVNGFGNMKQEVNLNADIQGMNRYFGWYEKRIGNIKEWVEGLEKDFPNHKTMLTEYGAEGNIDQHDEDTGDFGEFFGQFYPEEFSTKFHEIQWGVLSKHPYLLATYLWNTFDFATPVNTQGGVECRNMKGLVTFDRQVKKDPFYWYKANWSTEPVLYITQRRAVERTHRKTPVTVYSNQGQPELYVNGTKIENPKTGTTPVHYIFEDVMLKDGDNEIKASVTSSGKTLADQFIWTYDPQNEGKIRGGKKMKKVNEKEHSGL